MLTWHVSGTGRRGPGRQAACVHMGISLGLVHEWQLSCWIRVVHCTCQAVPRSAAAAYLAYKQIKCYSAA